MNETQANLIRDFAISGRRVQLALAPAGTGKTTALGVLAQAWREDGGTVVGLAPSAAAAAQLRAALGGTTDTIAKLLDGLDRGALSAGLAAIDSRTLVIVDEAAQSSTLDLDRVVAHALSVGASVRLVGDDRQLASIKSGGVLRDIARTVGAAPSMRRSASTTRPRAWLRWPCAEASRSLLATTSTTIGCTPATTGPSSMTRSRLGSRRDLTVASRCSSPPTGKVVRELNERVRADRLAGDQPAVEVRLHDGTHASAGDLIVTRKNNRRLPITATDWVKNGDRWQVDHVAADGSLAGDALGYTSHGPAAGRPTSASPSNSATPRRSTSRRAAPLTSATPS